MRFGARIAIRDSPREEIIAGAVKFVVLSVRVVFLDLYNFAFYILYIVRKLIEFPTTFVKYTFSRFVM